MSDPDPPKPSISTSTVPLKKETVRISLRAPSDDSGPVAPKGSTAPVAAVPPPTTMAPSPNTPPPAPVAPPAPRAPSPPSAPPAPGIPAAPPAGAKTIPLSKAPDPLGPTRPVPTAGVAAPPAAEAPAPAATAATAPVGAKTIPLAKAPGSGGPGPVGRVTTPLQPGGARPLPQATVKMGSTQPMGSTGSPTRNIPKQPNIQSTAEEVEEEWEEEYEESGLMPFAIIVLILALAVLAIELVTKMGAGS